MLRGDYREVAHQESVRVPLAFEELAVVLDVIDAWENFLEVSQAELLLFEVQDQLQIILSHQALLTFKELAH